MQKQRVSRACDTCKRRKIRCTGKQPCAHCIKNNKTCEFKAAYTRGAVPEVQSAPLEEQEKFLEEVGYKRRQVWRQSPRRHSDHVDESIEEEGGEEDGDGERDLLGYRSVVPNRTLPTRQHQKPESRSFDQSSPQRETHAKTSLFERTQCNINRRDYHQKNPVSAYGDPPLPEVDTSFLVLPSQSTAQAVINKYFDFVSATNRFLHQPTIEKWCSEFLNNTRDMRAGAEENSHRAVVLMLFACTYEYMDGKCGDWETSFYYFQAAENQLAKETGEVRLATLQARLLQCLYLLSRSRVNQCYSIFGTTVNFINILGIHRDRRTSNTSDLLEIEMQRRVFWSAYVTDKYLSSSLGRPQLLRDDDTDQALPLLVEDEYITSSFLQTTSKDTQVPMRSAIAQITLSQIMSNILCELYCVKKKSLETRFASASRLNATLRTWRADIAHFLDLDPSLLSPLYMRQNMALRLSYSHALILLHRPFLLDTFSHIEVSVPVLRVNLDENVKRCTDAAMDVARTIDLMYKMADSFDASWFAHYCAYTAVVALYLHVIKRSTDCPIQSAYDNSTTTSHDSGPSPWMAQFEAASRCQEQIKNSSTMAKESFAQKCSLVLEEARAEAVLKIRQGQSRQGDQNGERNHREHGMEDEGQEEPSNMRPQVQMEETSYFGGEWNDMNFDQSAPGGGVLYSIFNGVDGIRVRNANGSLVDRIDRWGFSSLTGY